MKTSIEFSKKLLRVRNHPRGFALIVTLSLMILLTVVAVGLLTLSSISLRTSAQGNAMAAAQANARLALMMAIGELQASAGVDQRITAPAGVLGSTTGQPMITGVWKSNKLTPTSTSNDFSKTTKTDKFVRWLVSGSETELKSEGFAGTKLPTDKKTVVDLVSATNLDPGASIVQAKKVELKGSGVNSAITTGKLAYAVLDEGAKVRTNLGVKKPTTDFAGTSTALGGGQRPSLAGISNIGTLASTAVDLDTVPGRALTDKIISLSNSEFAYNSGPGKMKFKLHDLTANSQGLLVDVANGGLKKDFNLLADETQRTGSLPAAYKNGTVSKGIYAEAFGSSVVSDPPWARATGWSNIYNTSAISKQTVGGQSVPTLTSSAPPGWVAGTGKKSGGTNAATAALSLIEPQGPVLLPSIAKVQMSFALAARDIYSYADPTGGKGFPAVPKAGTYASKGGNSLFHGFWDRQYQENILISVPPGATDEQIQALRTFDSPFDYLLHLVYSPIITLHNPYNIPLRFTNLRVEFVNVPFAFQVFKNDGAGFKAQSTEPVPFSTMYSNSIDGGQSKRFGLTLNDTMLPGEVKVYSPNIDPNRNWDTERRAGSNMVFWDWGNSNSEDNRTGGTVTDTSKSVGIAGWNGPSVGYDLDYLVGGKKLNPNRETFGGAQIDRGSGIPLTATSEIYVESTPLADPALPEKRFSVEMTLNWSETTPAADKLKRVSVLAFEFSNPNDLTKTIVGDDNPQAKDLKIRAPKGTDAWTTPMLFDHRLVTLKNIKNTEPFALFSAYAKTTASGSGSLGEDGLWVAKPFSFQNHTSVAINQKINQDPKKGHPSHYSHELALTRFPENDGFQIQPISKRGRFITGNIQTTGRYLASIYDVPLTPLQNFSTLNSAQLAAGTYLPHFSAPIGNSSAHPLLNTSSVIETGPAGYQYADHSFLLNAALFDSYYFSGLQGRAPQAKDGDGLTRDRLVDDFLASGVSGSTTSNPLPDQRIKTYLADGITRPEVANRLKANGAYAKAAGYQIIDGAFNVNSTSVNAWKAVLSSMSGENAQILATPDSAADVRTLRKEAVKAVTDTKGARFSRFRIPNGQPDRTGPDGFWRGSIDLSDAQLTSLATKIVEQIQERGPFLSMAEFVNRQLGSTDPKTLAGTLQTAIDKSGVNDEATAAALGNVKIEKSKTGNLSLATPDALVGDSTQGAPGYLMQADLLAVLGNAATVRSDTFKIRGYGESVDKTGNVTARAYCEAVVQRFPEYVDSQDTADIAPAALTSTANKNFGRRFQIMSFRWLSDAEI
jgi:Tfp pilus assembly protein PilV